jgi:UDP-glucose 4-epimerase
MKNPILVTGGLGYIGSHTVVELLEAGHEVVIADNLVNTRAEVLDGIEAITKKRPPLETIDVGDPEALAELFAKYPTLSSAIHFAAYKAVGESVREPLKYYRNNLNSTVTLLEELAKRPAAALVFSSSCTVYGEPASLPVTEQEALKPAESPYGNTKQICEDMIRWTVRAHPNLKAVCLRYFNPIGAHESAEIGELPLGVPDTLVPYITQTAAGVREKLTVFGSDYPTPDGTCIRDYLHVSDLAQAHLDALNLVTSDKASQNPEFFNLGSGTGYSVREVVETFVEATGAPLNWAYGDRRPGDVIQTYADATRAREILGWQTRRDLPAMLRSAWNWERKLRGLS